MVLACILICCGPGKHLDVA
jgi:DNA-binding Lrp family transcriptional regulator